MSSVGPTEFKGWQRKSQNARRFVGLATRLHPWSAQDPLLRGVPRSARCRDILDVCWFKKRKASSVPNAELKRGLFANLSQCVGRYPVTRGHVACYGPGSVVYSYEKDVVLLGQAQMSLIGWSIARTPLGLFSDRELRDLSSNSFSLPVCAIIQGVLAFNPRAPWFR